MNTQHTAAPWEVSEGYTNIWAKSPLGARVRLADVTKHSSMNGIDYKANAKLMAAAPDMLAAIESFLHSVENEGVIHGRVSGSVELAKEAINKATL
jgi:hypothetical protein